MFGNRLYIHPLGTRCEFSVYGILKALGRKTGKSEHEWLKNAFARLMGCGVELTNQQERKTYGGSLLEFMRDDRVVVTWLFSTPRYSLSTRAVGRPLIGKTGSYYGENL